MASVPVTPKMLGDSIFAPGQTATLPCDVLTDTELLGLVWNTRPYRTFCVSLDDMSPET